MNTQIQSGQDLEKVYKLYFAPLCNYAYQFVRDEEIARDVVQSIFTKLWENRTRSKFTDSIKSYLYGAVRNRSIDYLRKKKSSQKYIEAQAEAESIEMEFPDDELVFIRQKLNTAIQSLKPKCQKIFELHYRNGLTYKEISEHLDISKRTVEDNVSRAYTQLKKTLKEDPEFVASNYLTFVVLLIEMGALTEEFFL